MQIRVLLACLLLLFPGCFGDEEGPDFNGKNLNKMDVYKFTLSDTNQPTFHLLMRPSRSIGICIHTLRRCLLADCEQFEVCKITTDRGRLERYHSYLTIDWRHIRRRFW